MNKLHFNPVSGASFSGRNLLAVQESAKEHGYKSNKWITYFQAKELDALDGASLKGKAVGMVRFSKESGKSEAKWYNVFNVEEMPNIDESELKAKPSAKKATKKAAKKAAPAKAAKASPSKKAPKAAPEASVDISEAEVAIPVKGEPGSFLVKVNGVFSKITI